MKLLKYLFLNKKITIFIIFLVLYISHQIYFILIGGTTWDEPASIFSASKQIYKVYLTLVDFNNPILMCLHHKKHMEDYFLFQLIF